MADWHDLIGQLASFERARDLLRECGERVTAAEDFGDDGRGETQLVVARKVEERLHFVRQRVHGHETEETRVALDRMEGTENCGERFGVLRLLVEREQRGLDLLKMVHRLRMKFAE